MLFSGGRDSTLVAADILSTGRDVQLLMFTTGLAFGPDLVSVRVDELRERFGAHAEVSTERLNIAGLVRRFSLLDIESDILTDRVNLVHLGEALALLAASVRRFRGREGLEIYAGFTAYQSDFPEQRPVAIGWFREILDAIGMAFYTPLDSVQSEAEVKERLWAHSLSPKSLERSSMFADAHSVASDETIVNYLDRKRELFLRMAVGSQD